MKKLMCAAGLVLGISFSAGAATLFRDTFDLTNANPNTQDVNYQIALRQSGTLAPTNYNKGFDAAFSQVGNGGASNALLLAGRAAGLGSAVSINRNFTNAPGFQESLVIQFDVNPVQVGAGFNQTQNAWVAITFGSSSASRNQFPQNVDGVGILFRGSGLFQAYSAGQIVATGTYDAGTNDLFHHIKFTVTDATDGNPFDGTNDVTVTGFADYSSTPFVTLVRTNGFTNNYISLIGEGEGSGGDLVVRHAVDNLGLSHEAIITPYTNAAVLVVHWKMDETDSVYVSDSSGRTNLGVQLNYANTTSAWQPGAVNGALRFDGANDFVAHGYTIPVHQGTISHWLYSDDTNGSRVAVYQSDATSFDRNGFGNPVAITEMHTGIVTGRWMFFYQDGTSSGDIGNVAGFGRFNLTGPAVSQVWTHVAVTWDRTDDLILYVNGVEVDRQDMSVGVFANNPTRVRQLGRVGDGTAARQWLGLVDELQIYDGPLSAADIKTMFDYPGVTADPMNRMIGVSGSLAFGDVITGTVAQAALTITNSGILPVVVTNIIYTAGFSGAWSGSLAAGGSTNVAVTFAPGLVQAYGGTITVESDATSGSNMIGCSGEGIAVTRIIGVGGSLAFGSVLTGTTATAALTILNSGNSALTVTNIIYPTGFSGAWSGTLAAGEQTNVVVTFAPTLGQAYGGAIAVESDATGGSNSISCSGTGLVPVVRRLLADFDKDGKSDIVVYFKLTQLWTVEPSSGGAAYSLLHGASAITPVGADFDGDGASDFARYTNGTWSIKWGSNTATSTSFNWGNSLMYPVTADYDGDKKADMGVYYPSAYTWYVVQSGGGGILGSPTGIRLWASSYIPCPADFDGDGRDDVAGFKAGSWIIRLSSNGAVSTRSFAGASTNNMPVPADYDGDGFADLAVYDRTSGNWTIRSSSTGTTNTQNWGWFAAAPVPADYDGDGKADLAVYNKAGPIRWYVKRSSGGSFTSTLGGSLDVPVLPQFNINRRFFPTP